MSRTVEIPVQSMSLRVVLILSIGMVCLLVHFYAEKLAPSAQPFSTEWIDSGETDGQNHDSGEDLFVLPEYTGPKILLNFIRVICPESPVLVSIACRPLLPPPIAC